MNNYKYQYYMSDQNKIIILFILVILLLLYNILYVDRTLKIHSTKIDILGRYVNMYINHNISSNNTTQHNTTQHNTTQHNTTFAEKTTNKMKDEPEKGIKKFAIYHMKGCGHCHNFMDIKQNNDMTKFDELVNVFKNNNSIKILNFQYGRDDEAKKFTAFPVFKIITENGITDYNKERDVEPIIEAINNTN